MKIRNVHERELAAPASRVGQLIDRLATPDDPLWPVDRWPPLRLDRPLGDGAAGGHGPIGYFVEDYQPGRRVRFRFTRPAGFLGWHGFEVEEVAPNVAQLRHVLEMEAAGRALLSWAFVYRPLHDALIKDALDRAAAAVGGPPAAPR